MVDLGQLQRELEKIKKRHASDVAIQKRALSAYQRAVLKANDTGASVEVMAHELNMASFALTSK